jgi:hypothetical protein
MAEKKKKRRHNLAGVAASDETWERWKVLYSKERGPDESFAAWCRRKVSMAVGRWKEIL